MAFEISHRKQTDEERKVWERWCEFTDKAEVAPDVTRDAEMLARRYREKTGQTDGPSALWVWTIMPENHPNYPWTRT